MTTDNPVILNILKHLTSEPGVYQMLDASGEVIYVGKASHLKNRVSSYFLQKNHSAKTLALLSQIASIDITVTRSDKEALLLECTLIKRLQPKYNILMRDDKSFPYLCIQQKHAYPKMQVLRLKQMPEEGYFFGPYPSAQQVYTTLDLLQSIFKLRNCSDSEFARRQRPCLQYQIKKCSAPCVQMISKEDYTQAVQDALKFLQGKEQNIFQYFTAKMEEAVAKLAFEEAAAWRDKIQNLRMVQEQQAMICLEGELDVIVLQIHAGFAAIGRVSVREGRVLSSETFFPKIPNMHWYASEDEIWQEVFSDFVTFFYHKHPKQIPKLIICETKIQDEPMLLGFLKDRAGHSCRFSQAKRGQNKDWLAFAQNNLEKALAAHQTSWNTIAKRYQALAEFLKLETIDRMECFDISHTQGQETVASCVVFDQQGPSKKDYRRYNIENITPGDDYAAMRQVLLRRCKYYLAHPKQVPKLLIVDGGHGQLKQAQIVLADFMSQGMLLMGVSKGVHRKAGQEKLILAGSNQEYSLASDDEALHLIQHIRDEAHRFAISFHRAKRHKKVLESSLESIPGIGRIRRKILLQRFGGIRALRLASLDEIAKVPGISYDLAKRIFEHLRESY